MLRLKVLAKNPNPIFYERLPNLEQGNGKTTRMTLPYAQEVADKIVEYMKHVQTLLTS